MTRADARCVPQILTATRPLLRLLRQLSRGPCTIEPGETPAQIVLCGNGSRHGHSIDILEAAATAGLVQKTGAKLVARPETLSFLRRHLGDAASENFDGRPKTTAGQSAARDQRIGGAADGVEFANQHRAIVSETVELEGSRERVRRNLLESPLSGLTRLKDRDGRPFLPPEAIEAGERLAGDFERGHLQPKITACWEPRLSQRGRGEAGGKVDLTESAMAARARVTRAIEAMGPELSGVALDICCFEKGLELVERERGWPVRSAKLMLRTALLTLARHYAPPSAPRFNHSWGAEGFRPHI
jgi:hypothetical protein